MAWFLLSPTNWMCVATTEAWYLFQGNGFIYWASLIVYKMDLPKETKFLYMNFKIKITFHLGLITYTSPVIRKVLSPQQICMAVSLPPCIFCIFFMFAGWCIYDNDHEDEDDNGDYDDIHGVVHCPKANRWVNSGLAMKDWKGYYTFVVTFTLILFSYYCLSPKIDMKRSVHILTIQND